MTPLGGIYKPYKYCGGGGVPLSPRAGTVALDIVYGGLSSIVLSIMMIEQVASSKKRTQFKTRVQKS